MGRATPPMLLADFIDQGWDDHAERPDEVAERLAASLHLVQRGDEVAPFASLVTHVYGVHLGRWSDGVAVLHSLRQRLDVGDGAAAGPVLERYVAALRHAAGEAAAFDALDPVRVDDRICALAIASSALASGGAFVRAQASLTSALGLAESGLGEQSPALRALAVAGNNLAAALEEKTDRNEGETRAMLAAAECGLTYWRRAGTWLEEARALIRLACSRLQAGMPEAALQSALTAVAMCEANAASADEHAAATAVVALARRAGGAAAARKLRG